MKTKWWVAAALTLCAATASANPTCASLPGPIYVAGSTAVGPFIQKMGAALVAQNITLVYQSKGSCTGVTPIINDTTPTGACAAGACIKGSATYYDSTGTAQMCDLDPAGTHLHVGVSDVFVSTCIGTAAPSTIGDFPGPVEPILFVVPGGTNPSSQTAIVAEEAYFVFGFGGAGMVTPWTDPSLYFIRNSDSGTQGVIAQAIHVPSARMLGVDSGGSSGVLKNVTMSATPEKTIGIISAAFYDQNRATLKSLAFRTFQQKYAYYADSKHDALDKRNVRDGHYLPWGYLHLVTQVDSSGAPTDPKAKQFLDLMFGNTTLTGIDLLDLEITANTVPQCAMHVKRSSDGGDLSLYTAPKPCDCYFEQTAAKVTTCTACTDSSTCNGGTCRRGYCEVR